MHFADPDSGQPDLIPDKEPVALRDHLFILNHPRSAHLDVDPDHPIEGAVPNLTMEPDEVFTFDQQTPFEVTYRYSVRHTHKPPRDPKIPGSWVYEEATLIRSVVMTARVDRNPGHVLEECRRIARSN